MGKRNRKNNDIPADDIVPEYQDYINYEEDRNRQAERWRNRRRKDRSRDDYEDWDN